MELIERYLNEVGRRLPPKNREDILKELRSVILDKLEERVPEGQPSHNDYVEVLRSIGAPKKVATSYAGERYLIGPALYPTMIRVIQIGLWALLIIPAMGMWEVLTTDFTSMSAAFETAVGAIAEYFNAALGLIGMVVVIFAILEREQVRVPQKEEKWNPEDLPALNEPGRVSYFDMVFETAFNFVTFAFLSYFLQQGGIPVFYAADETLGSIVPINPESFIGLMIVTVVQIGLYLFVMNRGAWSLSTRLTDAMLDMVGLYYAFALVQQFAVRITDYVPALRPFDVGNWPVASVFGIIVLAIMLSHGIKIYRLLNPKPIASAPIKPSPAKG